jgi:hypothetical protein
LINNRQNGRRRGRGGGQGAPRPNGSGGGQDRGNRIDNRARGNAAQLFEKYKALARDAQMQGDRVNTEYYLQFADHYFRVLSESRSRFEEQQQSRPRRDDFVSQSDEEYADEGERIGEDHRQQPEPAFAMRETEATHDFGDRPPPRGRRVDEEGERDRAPREESRHSAEAGDGTEQSADEESRGPRRRGRPPRAAASEQIKVDRLPPSFSLQTQGEEEAVKPRPRTRRPRGEPASA